LLWWCLWLLGSWGTILLLDSPVPAARWMVFAGVLGMMLLWPLFRLSQAAGPPAPALPGVPGPPDGDPPALLPARQVLKDWLSLNLVFQAVLWPLQLTANWHLGQTAWLSAAVAAWSLLTAAVVAWGGRRPSRGVRISAMILCVLLMLGEPLVMAAVNLGPASGPGLSHVWPMVVSPIDTLWAATDSHYNWQPGLWGARIVGVAAAAALAWVGLAYSARSARDPRRR
jgi:hypothetical protein